MSKIRRTRTGRNGARPETLPLWLAADERERHASAPLTVAGRWLQRRAPWLPSRLADTYANANGLGGAK